MYPTLLNVIKQGTALDSYNTMSVVAKTILRADLTDAETSSLVDVITGNKNIYAAIDGAGAILKDAPEVRVTLDDTKKLASILREGLNHDDYKIKQAAMEAIIEIIHHGQMRSEHGQVLDNLAKDCAAALGSRSATTYGIDEGERAFVNRIAAFTADGPVPVWKPERRPHGVMTR